MFHAVLRPRWRANSTPLSTGCAFGAGSGSEAPRAPGPPLLRRCAEREQPLETRERLRRYKHGSPPGKEFSTGLQTAPHSSTLVPDPTPRTGDAHGADPAHGASAGLTLLGPSAYRTEADPVAGAALL